MRPVIVLDTETSALVPNYETGSGVIWELAMIERDCGAERLYRMALRHDQEELAEPKALEVGQYHRRTEGMTYPDLWEMGSGVFDLTRDKPYWSATRDLAAHVAGLLQDATIVAANPTFDANFLTAWLDHHGLTPTWHYRLRDIGSMAWGYLQVRGCPGNVGALVPAMDASTDDFAKALGVDPEQFERHSALGDCRLVAAMLDAMGGEA